MAYTGAYGDMSGPGRSSHTMASNRAEYDGPIGHGGTSSSYMPRYGSGTQQSGRYESDSTPAASSYAYPQGTWAGHSTFPRAEGDPVFSHSSSAFRGRDTLPRGSATMMSQPYEGDARPQSTERTRDRPSNRREFDASPSPSTSTRSSGSNPVKKPRTTKDAEKQAKYIKMMMKLMT